MLVLGLSAGDIVLVTIGPQGHLKEQHLKDVRGNLMHHWWSELMGGISSFNFDTIYAASLGPSSINHKGSQVRHRLAALVVAVNRCGEVRAWNVSRRHLVLQSSVYEMLSAVDGLEQFYALASGSSMIVKSVANRRSVNLDGKDSLSPSHNNYLRYSSRITDRHYSACMLRLCVDEEEDSSYVIVALAISTIDEGIIAGMDGQSSVVGGKETAGLSSWQVRCFPL